MFHFTILSSAIIIVFFWPKQEYKFNFPTAYARGILVGKLNMEIGEKVRIECVETELCIEIDFKVSDVSVM